MSQKLAAVEPVKVTHDDLKARGIVRSRYDQHAKIKAGKLRPPNKTSKSMQGGAWWWWTDILEDLERERRELEREALERAAGLPVSPEMTVE